MPIYSANRVSSVTQSFAVNENYDINDFGRILYESMINDQAIFEAVLRSDLREAVAIQEGTMTFNEADDASDSKFKSMCDACAKGLETVWEKIKGAFAAARRKITELCTRAAAAFNARFRKKVEEDIDTNGEITLETEVIFPESPSDISDAVDDMMEMLEKNIETIEKIADKMAASDGIATEAAAIRDGIGRARDGLGKAKKGIDKAASSAGMAAESAKNKILSACKATKKVGKATLNKITDIMTKAGPMVKSINETEKKIERRIKAKVRELRIAYRGSSPARKAKFEQIRTSLRRYQVSVTNICRGTIQSILEILKSCRRGLSEALHRAGNAVSPDKKRRNLTKHECAVIYAESDAQVDEVIDTPKDDLPEPDVCSSDSCDDDDEDEEANDININIKIDN